MSYTTEHSPCGHHVSKLKLIARTRTTPEKPKSLRIWRCDDCGKLYMELTGMPCEMTQETYDSFKRDGLLKEN